MSDHKTHVDYSFIEQQRKRLETLRDELRREEKLNTARAREYEQVHAQEARQVEDDAQRLAQLEIRQGLFNVDERRLRAVDRALQKIEDGTYGLSDASGDPIPKARLEAVPEAFLTALEEEQRERHYRP